ncbi:hypothetical protein SBA4_4930005 [Candidatus Sulfopaludibacter sp. SbA4]|nr:hypothetical protein SBA4_4930005 [Candidatus Sulfopaludibacter sp. SbA4]
MARLLWAILAQKERMLPCDPTIAFMGAGADPIRGGMVEPGACWHKTGFVFTTTTEPRWMAQRLRIASGLP